jgi:hypothetical protein
MDFHAQLKKLEEERKTLLDERANIYVASEKAKPDPEKAPWQEQKQEPAPGRSHAAVDEDLGKNEEKTAGVLKQISREETLNRVANELYRLDEERKAAEQCVPRQQEGTEATTRPPADATASSIGDIDKAILKTEEKLKNAVVEFKSRLQQEGAKEISGEAENAIARAEGGARQRPSWEKDSVVETSRSEQTEAHLRLYKTPERSEHQPRLHGGGETDFKGGHPSQDINPRSAKPAATGVWTTRDEVAGKSDEQLKDAYALEDKPTHIAIQIVPEGTTLKRGTAGEIEGWGAGGGDQYRRMDSHDKVRATPGYDIEGGQLERRTSLDFNAHSSKDDHYRNAAKLVEPGVGAQWQKEHDAAIASLKAQKDLYSGDKVLQAEVAKSETEKEALAAKHLAQDKRLDKCIEQVQEKFDKKYQDKDPGEKEKMQTELDKQLRLMKEAQEKQHERDWERFLEGKFKQLS